MAEEFDAAAAGPAASANAASAANLEPVRAEMGTAARGVAWASLSRITAQGALIVSNIVMARLLLPRDFGLMAMVAVFVQLANALTDLGLSQAIITLRTVRDDHLTTAFVMNLATGVLLSLLFIGAGPVFAHFYHEPALVAFTPIAGLVFTLNFTVVPAGILIRRLRFKSYAFSEASSALLGGTCGVTAALLGAKYWSLAVGPCVAALSQSLGLLLAARWRPKGRPTRSATRDLWGFAGQLTGASLIGYAGRNLDKMFVGRFLGSSALGIYSRGYALMLLPLYQVTHVLQRVALPSLAQLRDDVVKRQQVFLRTLGLVALLAFPISLDVGGGAPDLVPVLLGNRWIPLIHVLQVLCVAGMMQALVGTAEWVFISQARNSVLLRTRAVSSTLTIGGAALAARFDVLAVATAVTVGTYVGGVWTLRRAAQLAEVSAVAIVRAVLGPLVASIVGFGALSAVRVSLSSTGVQPELRLATEAVVGTGTYLAIVLLGRFPQFDDLRLAMRSLRARRSSERPSADSSRVPDAAAVPETRPDAAAP